MLVMKEEVTSKNIRKYIINKYKFSVGSLLTIRIGFETSRGTNTLKPIHMGAVLTDLLPHIVVFKGDNGLTYTYSYNDIFADEIIKPKNAGEKND